MLFTASLPAVFTMNGIQNEKKGREARRNDERLYYKFIVKYMEGLHQDLFKKAVDLYNDAKQNNPSVRDLTKTVQFMTEVMPNTPIPRYYKNRQTNVIKPRLQQQQMVLRIPLVKLPVSQTSPQVSHPSPPVSQPSPQVSHPSPPVSQPSPQVLHPSPPVSQPSPHLPVPVSSQTSQHLLPLAPDVYQELLNELQQNPELQQILNDFPDNDETTNNIVCDDIDMSQDPGFVCDESMNSFVWDAIDMYDISPLENEILGC